MRHGELRPRRNATHRVPAIGPDGLYGSAVATLLIKLAPRTSRARAGTKRSSIGRRFTLCSRSFTPLPRRPRPTGRAGRRRSLRLGTREPRPLRRQRRMERDHRPPRRARPRACTPRGSQPQRRSGCRAVGVHDARAVAGAPPRRREPRRMDREFGEPRGMACVAPVAHDARERCLDAAGAVKTEARGADEVSAIERRPLVLRALGSTDERCQHLLQALFLGASKPVDHSTGQRFIKTVPGTSRVRAGASGCVPGTAHACTQKASAQRLATNGRGAVLLAGTSGYQTVFQWHANRNRPQDERIPSPPDSASNRTPRAKPPA